MRFAEWFLYACVTASMYSFVAEFVKPSMTDKSAQSTTPLWILTGFLGSGKTTLVSRMLRESKGRFFVLNNEIGGISVR